MFLFESNAIILKKHNPENVRNLQLSGDAGLCEILIHLTVK
jgi:hypothetical protein